MAKQTINFGYANGWDKNQRELADAIIAAIRKQPTYTSSRENIGNCDNRYIHECEDLKFIYCVDSSD